MNMTPNKKHKYIENKDFNISNTSDFDNSMIKYLSEFDINSLDNHKLSSPISNTKNPPVIIKTLTDKIKQKLLEQKLVLNNNSIHYKNKKLPKIDFVDQDTSFYGLPFEVKNILKRNYDITALYDWQIKCLKFSEEYNDKNLIYSLPTSGGKTLVAELMILKEILFNHKNALLILPYISIVQEKVRKMSVYADALGFLLEEYAGNKGHFPPKHRRNKRTLYVATIEKANMLLDHFLDPQASLQGGGGGQGLADLPIHSGHGTDLMDGLGIVVIDELHMIGSQAGGHRAAILESIVTKVRYRDSRNGNGPVAPPTKLVGMSATLPASGQGLCAFMGGRTFTSHFRPVELREYVKMGGEIYVVKGDALAVQEDEGTLPPIELFRTLKWPGYYTDRLKLVDPDQIFVLVAETISIGSAPNANNWSAIDSDNSLLDTSMTPASSCLVFCPTKKNCENVAAFLARIAEMVIKRRRKASKLLKCLTSHRSNKGPPKSPRTSLHSKTSPTNASFQRQRVEKLRTELDTLPHLDDSTITTERRSLLIKNLTQTESTSGTWNQTGTAGDPNPKDVSSGGGKICSVLRRAIRYGIAYHHSGLTTDERKMIEEAYSTGLLSVLCCTSTLAAGVNLPAKRVILKSPNIGNTTLSAGQYRQMIGRAGRAGLISDAGESFLVLNDPERQRRLLPALLTNDPAQSACTSGMAANDLRGFKSLFLSSIGLKIARTDEELHQLFDSTLYAHQLDDMAKLSVVPDVITARKVLEELRAGKLIYPTTQKSVSDETHSQSDIICYGVTKLGRAIFKSSIDQKFSTKLYQDLRRAQEIMVLSSHLHLLHLITPYEIGGIDMSSHSNIDWNLYVSETNRLSPHEHKVMEVIGVPESYLVRQMTCQGTDKRVDAETVGRFYCTIMLYRLWKRESFWDVSQTFHVDRGFVQNLFQSSSSFAYSVFNFTQEFDEFWALRELLEKFVKQFHHLVSKELLPLIDLPGVKIGRIRQLYNAGYRSLFQVAQAKPDHLIKDIKFLSRKLAQEIIASAKMLLREKAESLEDEAVNILSQLALC